MSTTRTYKIVPVVEKSNEEKIRELREFLAANVSVNIEDQKFDRAATYQQHLDLVDVLIENSRDRI